MRDILPEQLSLFYDDDDERGGLAGFYLSSSLYTVHTHQLLHLLLASSSYIFSSSSTRYIYIYIYGRIYIVTPHYSNTSGVLLQSMAFAS